MICFVWFFFIFVDAISFSFWPFFFLRFDLIFFFLSFLFFWNFFLFFLFFWNFFLFFFFCVYLFIYCYFTSSSSSWFLSSSSSGSSLLLRRTLRHGGRTALDLEDQNLELNGGRDPLEIFFATAIDPHFTTPRSASFPNSGRKRTSADSRRFDSESGADWVRV